MSKTLIVLLALLIPRSTLFCQATQESAPIDQHLAAHVVYGAFFRHVLALENAAAEHDKAGRNGNEVRAYYQNAMKLSDAEAATMKRIAGDCQNAIRALDAKAKKIINDAWAPFPDHRVPPGAQPPAIPEELSRLDKERIAAIEAHIKKLEATLDPAVFKKIDAYVRDVFAKQVSVIPANPHSVPAMP